MKNIILIVLLIVFFCSMITINRKTIDNDFCKQFKTMSLLTKHNYIPSEHYKIDVKNLQQIDSVIYRKLNNSVKPDADKNFIYGRFQISNYRFGLVCYNKVREGDDNVNYFSLYIIDSCSIQKDFKILSLNDKHSGILYQLRSLFNKNFTELTITLKRTSEWVVGSDFKKDTLFTESYLIDLKSINLDTLSVKKAFKVIKR